MDVAAAAPPAAVAEASMVLDLSARRAALQRRRRAGRLREWLAVVAIGGGALWVAAIALLSLVAH